MVVVRFSYPHALHPLSKMPLRAVTAVAVGVEAAEVAVAGAEVEVVAHLHTGHPERWDNKTNRPGNTRRLPDQRVS